MTCSMPSDDPIPVALDLERALGRAKHLFREHGFDLTEIPGVTAAMAEPVRLAATASGLMEVYRRSGSAEVFECLVHLAGPQLQARVRSRMRYLGAHLDPNELLQDAIINIYRYPDRFEACRPGAFAAWSSTIVDNTIRRQLRRGRTGLGTVLNPVEVLAQHPDAHAREPDMQAQDVEECRNTMAALHLLLGFYLIAFQRLSERERFVLQMVEVRQMRYAQVATVLAIRPEALKMVVFRARKRLFDRMAAMMAGSEGDRAEIAAELAVA
jgi:RNA polymerase sigma factor (sigma-70 family)